MSVYRFQVTDPMNEYFRAIEVDADSAEQAVRRAEAMLFARRPVGVSTGIRITAEGTS